MKNEYLNKGRKEQKLETRERILQSAQDLLQGGRAISLEDVARHAGISRATIYRYYSNLEILLAEAGLNIKTKSPDSLYEAVKSRPFESQVLEIQEYYNDLALDNEHAFRQYLSSILKSDSAADQRGARRNRTLKKILEHSKYTQEQKQDLENLLTVLMGIEPLIVTKDVCRLSDTESKALLRWGIELILKGIGSE